MDLYNVCTMYIYIKCSKEAKITITKRSKSIQNELWEKEPVAMNDVNIEECKIINCYQ